MNVKLGYSNLYWINQDQKRIRELNNETSTGFSTQSDRVQDQTFDDKSSQRNFREVRSEHGDERRDVQRSESGMFDSSRLDKDSDKGQRRPLEEPRLLRHSTIPLNGVSEPRGNTENSERIRDEGSIDDQKRDKTDKSVDSV